MKESDFTSRVHSKLNPKEVRAWKILDDYQGGVPDAYYHLKKKRADGLVKLPLFIEYKYLKKLPVRDTTMIVPDCSDLQLDWLEELMNNGSRPKVIVGFKDGHTSKGVMFHDFEWLQGLSKTDFVQRVMTYNQLANTIYNILTYE